MANETDVRIGFDEGVATEQVDPSRRKFLKILGQSSVAGAAAVTAGCAPDISQTIFPSVKGEEDQIPGVSVWYRSTCAECSAGCGVQVRTREGRAVKIEGSPDSPINSGGLCALGQSAVQHHYDPDRIREPLVKEKIANTLRDGAIGGLKDHFKAASWSALDERVTARLQDNAKKKYLLTGEVSGALAELIGEFCKAFQVEHVVYDLLQPVAVAKASELVYGSFGVPNFAFDKADVVVSFGADFLETWVSPVEFARDWAKGRRRDQPIQVFQVEPRGSLTAANADHWLCSKPGSELQVALYLLQQVLKSGRGEGLRADLLERATTMVGKVTLAEVSTSSGIPEKKLSFMAERLVASKTPLVLAGGAAAAGADPLPLAVAAALLNLVLGSVGTTVQLGAMRKPQSSLAKLREAIESMDKVETGLLLTYNTNPAFTLPTSYNYNYAVKKVGLVAAVASHQDETALAADLIFASHSSLESWGDHRPYDGVYSLQQPTMRPLYDTQHLGDMLLRWSTAAGKSSEVGGGAKDFLGYLKASWEKVKVTIGDKSSSEDFWLSSVERGGYFNPSARDARVKVTVSDGAFQALGSESGKVAAEPGLFVFPFPSVKSFDGRAANRPWLLELPDPMTSAVWDSWAELHPETAKGLGIERGDLVTVRNQFGEVTVPAYVTDYVHRDVIAVPMGQGHTGYGRFATQIPGANVMTLLAATGTGAAVPLISTKANVMRARGKGDLVTTMGSDSQHDRELARTIKIPVGGTVTAALAGAAHGHGAGHGAAAAYGADHGNSAGSGHGGGHGGGHGPVKQMYEQREHPLYKWGLGIDLNACTGCSACVVACYAENNIAVVGKEQCSKGREMSWLRIERYHDGSAEELQVSFLPMMCQHCNNAPCEPVCPVYATYHNEEGLNAMIYNRCVGTRYCSNNCSYKVRRFNWYEYDLPEPMQWQLNPDIVKRSLGVMEKCTFCVQRINEAKDHAKDLGRKVEDGEIQPACVQGCPTKALVFGNLNDPDSEVSRWGRDGRAYKVLDHHINTQPSVSYLERVRYES